MLLRYYIIQCLHLDIRRDLVHNIHGIITYISYCDYVRPVQSLSACKTVHFTFTFYDYVPSLTMAITAETRCLWLLINEVVWTLDLYPFTGPEYCSMLRLCAS